MQPKHRFILELLLCLGILIGTPLWFLQPMFQEDSIPLSLGSIFQEPPWEEARPSTSPAHEDPYLAQHAMHYYPAYHFMRSSIEEDVFPLWNPKEGFGAPFLALWSSRVLSPFSIPLYLLPLIPALQWSVLLKMLVAGFSAFYAALRLGFPMALALFVGLCYQLSGPIFLWAGFPMSDVLPWLPLFLLCLERFVLGQYRFWPHCALVLALMGLGGDPPTFGAVLLLGLIFLVIRRFRDPQTVHLSTSLPTIITATLLALGILGVQLLPFLEYIQQAVFPNIQSITSLQVSDLKALLDPTGNILTAPDASRASLYKLLFVGSLPVLLIPLWLAIRPDAVRLMRRRMEVLIKAAALMACIPLVFGLHNHLPGLQYLGPEHFLIALGLAFIILAAGAAEEWLALSPAACRATLKRLLILLPLTWGALLGLLAYSRHSVGLDSPFTHVALIALGVLFLLLVTLFYPSPRFMGYGLSALAVVNLFWLSAGLFPTTPREHIFPETPFIQSLQQVNARIGGSDAMKRWPLAGNNIAQVYSPNSIYLARYMEFMDQVENYPLLLRRGSSQAFLLTKEDIQGEFAAVRPVLNIQEVFPTGAVLFRDLEAEPRARMIYAARSVDAFDASQLHPERPPLLEGANLAESDSGAQARARIDTPEHNNEVRVQVERTRPGVLVLADAWYPGWQAAVNGKSTPILPVDGIFRGVEVGEGDHEVVFTYAPRSLYYGLGLSLVCLLFTLFSMWRLRRRALA